MRGVFRVSWIYGYFLGFLSEGSGLTRPGLELRWILSSRFEWFHASLFVAQTIFADVAKDCHDNQKNKCPSLWSPPNREAGVSGCSFVVKGAWRFQLIKLLSKACSNTSASTAHGEAAAMRQREDPLHRDGHWKPRQQFSPLAARDNHVQGLNAALL